MRLTLDMSRCQGRAKWIATAGGLGYSPIAPGTVGSLLGWAIWLAIGSLRDSTAVALVLVSLIGGTLGAVRASTEAERLFAKHDPSCVVIDEVVGMLWVLVLAPSVVTMGWAWQALAFALFRLFDIVKPPPLKWFATAPGGWGIVLDDLGAAVYAVAVVWAVHAGLPGR